MIQRTDNASTLDTVRAYPTHCPAHRSVRRANRVLLMVDSRALKHGNCLFSTCMGDSVIFILEDSPSSSSARHCNTIPHQEGSSRHIMHHEELTRDEDEELMRNKGGRSSMCWLLIGQLS